MSFFEPPPPPPEPPPQPRREPWMGTPPNVIGAVARIDRPDLVIAPHGGGGGDRCWQQEFWVWPLPPRGDLTLACERPAIGIQETHVAVDASTSLDAATRAETLWPDDARDDDGGSSEQIVVAGSD